MKKTFTVIGFGDRGEIYAKYALKHNEEMEIIAVVDPNKVRRDYAKQLFNIKDEYCFEDFNDFIKLGRISDCVINATMDDTHIKTTLPLLPLGYDILLEKPITAHKEELLELKRLQEKYNNKIVICHVLRYTPFYRGIKDVLTSGEIGKLKVISTEENVGFCHASTSFVRGKWNSEAKCGSSFLLQKCCHDTDLISWFNNTSKPKFISSFATKKQFLEENAPKNSGTRCLVDCNIEKECPFSCKKMYIDNDSMPELVWANMNKLPKDISIDERIESLKNDNPYGRCVYKTDSDIVDNQMLMIIYEDGSMATHSLVKGCTKAGRRIKIYGEKGEIESFTEDSKFIVRTYNEKNVLYNERVIEIKDVDANDGHNGGDSRIVKDFLEVCKGNKPSISTSSLTDSINSHLIVYAADESRKTMMPVEIK